MSMHSAAPGEFAALQAGKIIGNAASLSLLAPDRAEISRALSVLHAPDEVIELRVLHQKGRRRTDAGYFDGQHREQLIEAAAKANEHGAAVYAVMNELDPQLLARYANRVKEYADATATDANVTRRRWLLIDIDPTRPKDTSSTTAQFEAAKGCARRVYSWLAERGWPAPVVAESGNGMHLLYKIDRPNDEASRDLVKGCLEALASKFDDDVVKIDRAVFNAARITKLYGTVANKGDNVAAAPWRLSQLRTVPESVEIVSSEHLQELAAQAVKSAKVNGNGHAPATNGHAWTSTAVSAFLERGGIEVLGEPAPHDGAIRFRLRRCPFNPDHGPTESAVFLHSDGRLGFKCSHNSCADRHWGDLRELVDGPRESRRSVERPKVAEVAGVAALAIEPETLRRPLPPAAPYPIDALGPILGAAAQRVHEVIQAPLALCGQSFLAAASLAAQCHADVSMDGRHEPLSLFAVTIAESGERKTAVDRLALLEHRSYERDALEVYRHELEEYQFLETAYDAKKRFITKGGKGATPDSIEAALRELKVPEEPPNPIFLAPTPTLEGIHKLYASGRPSIGIFHDDAGEFIGGHAMSDENRMKSAAGLSRLWDFGEFDRIRAGDGAHKFYGRRLALHLMMQPVIAEKVLSDDILTGQGLLARTLMVWPASTIGDRRYVELDLTADPAITRYRTAISALLALPPRLKDGTRNELEPPTLGLSAEAKAVWVTIHNAIESDQKDGGAWASVRAWASKAPAQALRIAGVLTLLEAPAARQIEAETIVRAAQLVDHHLGEAARIVGTASVPAEIRNAEALRDWCHREHKALLHSRAALQFGPGSIRTVTAFDAAIEILERTGWAQRIERGAEIDGTHRRRAWAIRKGRA